MSDAPYGRWLDDAELMTLMDACANDTATAEQWNQLNARLARDPAALEFYVAHRHLQAKLSKSARAAATAGQRPLHASPAAALPAPQPRLLGAPLRFISAPVRFGIFFACVTVVSLTLFFAQIKMQAPPTGDPAEASFVAETPQPSVRVARIVSTVECRWNGTTPISAVLTSGQQLDLLEGKLELDFEDGARLWVQGPSRLHLVSGSQARLQQGAVFANVSERARGFTLSTPHAEVIDLGTEFGVTVDSTGASQVMVLEGRVRIATAAIRSHLVSKNELVEIRGAQLRSRRLPASRRAEFRDFKLSSVHLVRDSYGHHWNSPEIWSDQALPSVRRHYHVANGPLRTPLDNNARPFAGGPLSLHPKGSLVVKHTGVTHVADLRFEGGAIVMSNERAGTPGITLAGAFHMLAPATVMLNGSELIWDASLEGFDAVRVEGPGRLVLRTDGRDFHGAWRIENAQLVGEKEQAWGDGDIWVSSQSTLEPRARVHAPRAHYTLESGAMLRLSHPLTLRALTLADESLPPGEYPAAQLQKRYPSFFGAAPGEPHNFDDEATLTVVGGTPPSKSPNSFEPNSP